MRIIMTGVLSLFLVLAACATPATPTAVPTPRGPGWTRVKMECTFQGPEGPYEVRGTYIVKGARVKQERICPPGLRHKPTGRIDAKVGVAIFGQEGFSGFPPLGLAEGIFLVMPSSDFEMLSPVEEVPD